jgi:hypothetical protein
MKRSIAACFVMVLVLGACTGGRGGPASTTSTASSTTLASTTTSTAGATTAPVSTSSPTGSTTTPQGGNCAPISGGGETFLQLTNVRVGTHTGYDRVTFEFAPPSQTSPPVPAPPGVLPKYELTRVSSITEDGSGKPVEVSGKDLYLIVFHGASGFDLTGPDPVPTYKGPKELKPNFKVLNEVERSGDFEATLSWGIGLKERRCLKVAEFNSPLRLAIDIPH